MRPPRALRELEIELQAADDVTSAPSVEEIKAANALAVQINDLAIADAAREAALTLFSQALSHADDLRRDVSIA